jgi:hypothetical protein
LSPHPYIADDIFKPKAEAFLSGSRTSPTTKWLDSAIPRTGIGLGDRLWISLGYPYFGDKVPYIADDIPYIADDTPYIADRGICQGSDLLKEFWSFRP